jgi:hypothetical protein
MKIEDLIKELKLSSAKVVGKEIGICDKRLLGGLKKAGYKYNKKSGIGWYFTGQGEAPLKVDIREFIAATDDTQEKNTDTSFTKKEVSEVRKMLSEWDTTKNTFEAIVQQKEKDLTHPIHSLYMRIGESGAKEKASRTVNIDKEVWSILDTCEDIHRLNRDEIVEFALWEFFRKYKVQ